MTTMQEQAWAGEFGDAYHERSPGNGEANFHLFRNVLYPVQRIAPQLRVPKSVLELGAGTGANLRALRRLLGTDCQLTGVEINPAAAAKIDQPAQAIEVYIMPLRQFWTIKHPTDPQGDRQWDLVLTKGFLIHIPPEDLLEVYLGIYERAKRWILLAEYYSPKPQMIDYRGNANMLWKRDFAGEMLDRFPDLKLADYGFVYHRDPHPQDDLTWFLLEKQ